jgi:hypothetical protein
MYGWGRIPGVDNGTMWTVAYILLAPHSRLSFPRAVFFWMPAIANEGLARCPS